MNPPKPPFGQADVVYLSDEEEAAGVVQEAVMGLWGVVNALTRLRRRARQNYRVTIFGSARLSAGAAAYERVKELAMRLTQSGCDIISGGGPGLMKAANEGARAAAPDALQRSVGIRVDLPFEQETNDFVGQAYSHGTFFSRLHHFMLVSDAIIVVPGGIGSLLELSMAWQLLQVRRLYNVPLIVVGEMWGELVDWGRRHMLQEGSELASELDFAIPRCVGSVEEAVAVVEENRRAWLAGQEQDANEPSSMG